MKKIVLTSIIAASSLFAATDEQILGFYKQIFPPEVNVKITSREKLAEQPEFEAVILKLSDGQNSEDEIVFTKGDLLLPDILDLKNSKGYKGEFKNKIMTQNISKIYQAEKKENIITIGNDKNKPTMVMFSDPECPYCRKELENIEKTLEKNNLKIILAPVHDRSSLEKSYLIYKDIKSAKSDSQKVKILRKYFAPDYSVAQNSVTDAQVDQMEQLRGKYQNAGVRSVPFFIDENTITKR